ncbi:MAG: hypothetical protein GY953_46490, partial [bacterium]|nr:hypothetical protein [bacterium]
MTIEFEHHANLPPLSWCAHARAGAAVRFRHGSDVETRENGFVEGAWDGEFEAFDFDQAHTLAGSGGRLRRGTLVFAAGFHPLERLFVLRRRDETFVSNSLVFLLSEAGVRLDLSYPNYYFDFLAQIRRGIGPPPSRLRTATNECVELFPCSNLEWRPDGTLRRMRKPLPPQPNT